MKSRTDNKNEKLAQQPGLLLTSFKLWDWILPRYVSLWVVGGCPFKTFSSVQPQVGGWFQASMKLFPHGIQNFFLRAPLTR